MRVGAKQGGRVRVGAREQGRVKVGAGRGGGGVRVGARQGAKSQHGHSLVSHSRVAGRSSWVSERKTTQMVEERPQPPGKDKAAVIRTESGTDTQLSTV